MKRPEAPNTMLRFLLVITLIAFIIYIVFDTDMFKNKQIDYNVMDSTAKEVVDDIRYKQKAGERYTVNYEGTIYKDCVISKIPEQKFTILYCNGHIIPLHTRRLDDIIIESHP